MKPSSIIRIGVEQKNMDMEIYSEILVYIILVIVTLIPVILLFSLRENGGFRKGFYKIFILPYTKSFSKLPRLLFYFFIVLIILTYLLLLLFSYENAIILYNNTFSIDVLIYTLTVTISSWTVLYMVFLPFVSMINYIGNYISNFQNTKMSIWSIISFLLPLTYLLLFFSNQSIIEQQIFLLLVIPIGLIFSCYGIFRCIVMIISNPLIIKTYGKFSKVTGFFVWTIILLLNLTCIIFLIYSIEKESFLSNGNLITSYFDLFYFTIISFSTIGYGDIVPATPLGKIGSIIIVLSSILYLIIFVTVFFSNYYEGKKLHPVRGKYRRRFTINNRIEKNLKKRIRLK